MRSFKSKRVDDNYVILFDGYKFPIVIEQEKVDSLLPKLVKALGTFCHIDKEIQDDTQLDDFIQELTDYPTNTHQCLATAHDINEALHYLYSHDDYIPDPEDMANLQDLGFNYLWGYNDKSYSYGKILSETFGPDTKTEIVEELFLKENPIIHRKRTIIYKKTNYGYSSISITYEDLPIDEKLKKAINNTKRENEI